MSSRQTLNTIRTVLHPISPSNSEVFSAYYNCIPILHGSKAWLCFILNAQFPMHSQDDRQHVGDPSLKRKMSCNFRLIIFPKEKKLVVPSQPCTKVS